MKTALGIIDAQRGFMPAEEGERLGLPGFGELGVPGGAETVPSINNLLGAFAAKNAYIFTTQDWHPTETAHFATEPDFNTTWPVHCVAETPGAEIHPEIKADTADAFIKGDEPLEDGSDDDSYSGFNAHRPTDMIDLPKILREKNVETVVLGGLALDHCVKATALDLKQAMGLDVTIVSDATAPVTPETGRAAIEELEAAGIRFATTAEILEQLAATAE